jgi:hypothetical protein
VATGTKGLVKGRIMSNDSLVALPVNRAYDYRDSRIEERDDCMAGYYLVNLSDGGSQERRC